MNQKGYTLSEQSKSKGLAPILLILGVFVIAVIAGGVYLFGKSSVKSPTPPTQISASPTPQSTKTDETANWKTYTDKSFTFKYPANWKLGTCTGRCIGNEIAVSHPEAKYPDGILTIEILDTKCGGLAEQSWSKPVTKETFILGGVYGFIIKGKLDLNDNQLHDVKNICISVEAKGYLIRSWSLNNPQQEEVFNQILSTFKFTQ